MYFILFFILFISITFGWVVNDPPSYFDYQSVEVEMEEDTQSFYLKLNKKLLNEHSNSYVIKKPKNLLSSEKDNSIKDKISYYGENEELEFLIGKNTKEMDSSENYLIEISLRVYFKKTNVFDDYFVAPHFSYYHCGSAVKALSVENYKLNCVMRKNIIPGGWHVTSLRNLI